MKHIRMMTMSLLLLGLLAACATPNAQTNPLVGGSWKLESLRNAQGQTISALPEPFGTLEFNTKQAAGTTGCNRYFASYTQKGNNLSLGSAGSTTMACEEPRMAQESAFLAALQQVSAYRLHADQLELLDVSGNVQMTFSALKPLPMVGTQWVMTAVLNGTEAVSSPVEGVEVSAIFNTDGSVNGKSGCNAYSGNYQVDGEKITIQLSLSTMMTCQEPGVMEQENAYLQALEKAASFKLSYNSLEIFNKDGVRLISYGKKAVTMNETSTQPLKSSIVSTPSNAAPQSFSDPFAYCAAVVNIDKADARYTGPKINDQIIKGYLKAAGINFTGEYPDSFKQMTIWRCMDKKVYACNFGANLPCDSKANTDKTPTQAMIDFCKENKNSDFIPMSVTGHETIYHWHCKKGAAEAVDQIDKPDAAGYLTSIWYAIESNP